MSTATPPTTSPSGSGDTSNTSYNVFYSWQSDLPSRTNRRFIEEALQRVAGALRADESIAVEPAIDRDTAGVSGSPAISDTIFEKITRAEVFVPDVSLVTSSRKRRPSPNPNVLLELGYAVSKFGWDRIVMVMNTAFGDLESLPFDLRGRRVVAYSLPDSGAAEPKADVRRDLERRLKDAIVAILRDHGVRARQEAAVRRQSLVKMAMEFRDERIRLLAGRQGTAARLSSSHFVCVHAVPIGAVTGSVQLDLANIDEEKTFAAPFGSTGYNRGFNADGIIRENVNGSALDGYWQLFSSGIIESVDSRMMVGRGREDGLPCPAFVTSLSQFVSDTLRVWRALKIAQPGCMLITLTGVSGLSILLEAYPGYVTHPFPADTIRLPEVVIEDFTADPRPALRRALDVLWQTAGRSGCEYFDSSGNWVRES